MASITYYEPFTRRSIVSPPPQVQPWVSLHPNGRFRFNHAAIKLLGLRKNMRVMLGSQREDPREWFVQLVREGGHLLRDMASGQTTRTCPPSLGFGSLDLLMQVHRTLPYAPQNEFLRFKFEGLTELHPDGSEAWPLLTAPYWQRQEKPAPSTLRQASFAVPGLLGIVVHTQRYEAQPLPLPMPVEAEAAPSPLAVPPGQLAQQALVAAGYTIASLAHALGCSYQQLYFVLSGRTPFTAALAVGLEAQGLGPAAYWLHLHADWELARARLAPPQSTRHPGRPRQRAQLAAGC